MDGDVAFNAASLSVIGVLLSALAGAITILFRQLVSSKDAAIAASQRERDDYRRVALEAVRTSGILAELHARSAGIELPPAPAPTLPSPLPPPAPRGPAPAADPDRLLFSSLERTLTDIRGRFAIATSVLTSDRPLLRV